MHLPSGNTMLMTGKRPWLSVSFKSLGYSFSKNLFGNKGLLIIRKINAKNLLPSLLLSLSRPTALERLVPLHAIGLPTLVETVHLESMCCGHKGTLECQQVNSFSHKRYPVGLLGMKMVQAARGMEQVRLASGTVQYQYAAIPRPRKLTSALFLPQQLVTTQAVALALGRKHRGTFGTGNASLQVGGTCSAIFTRADLITRDHFE